MLSVLAASQGVQILAGFGITIGIICAYLLPAWIAVLRHLPNSGAVLVINLLLGWTGIFWIIALIMALTSKPRPYTQRWTSASRP